MFLLKDDLKSFANELPKFYRFVTIAGVNDSLPPIAADSLPRAYREALLISGNPDYAHDGKVVIGSDTIARFTDAEFLSSYNDYCYLKATLTDEKECLNRSHRMYGNTFWWYHDFGKKAHGSLSPR